MIVMAPANKMAEGVVTPAFHNHPLSPPTAPSIVNVRMPCETRLRTVGMSGPLTFNPDGCAAECRNHERKDVGGRHHAFDAGIVSSGRMPSGQKFVVELELGADARPAR
jgi:hypothetical protein